MPLISIHIPKTGGTTFLELLSDQYKDKLLLDYGLSREDGPSKVNQGKYDCVHGHFISDKYAAIKDAEFVLWLRNPIQRLFSQYYFWKQNSYPHSPAWRRFYLEEWSFADFALFPGFRNGQSKYVGSLDINAARVVGITEFYNESLELFKRELCMHIDAYNVPQHRKNRNLVAGGSYELNDKKLEAAILEYHKKDYELYLNGLELFRKKYDSFSTKLSSGYRGRALKGPSPESTHLAIQKLLIKEKTIKWRLGKYYYGESCPINMPESLVLRGLLSFAWWVFELLLYMIVLYIIFGLVFQQASGDYVPFLLCGLVFWKWFDSSVRNVSTSIQRNTGLIYQIYSPKRIIPLVLLTTSTLRFSVMFCLLIAFLMIRGVSISSAWFIDVPLLMLLQIMLVAGIGMTWAAITQLAPYTGLIADKMLLLLFFFSGIFFNLEIIPESIRGYFELNPIAMLIDNYRHILLDGHKLNWGSLISVIVGIMLFFPLGSYMLRKYDRAFINKAFR